jgi:hypothetical protein
MSRMPHFLIRSTYTLLSSLERVLLQLQSELHIFWKGIQIPVCAHCNGSEYWSVVSAQNLVSEVSVRTGRENNPLSAPIYKNGERDAL